MSNIFISHSWHDNHFAQEVIDYLKQIGHKSLYLDFDPNHGTPPGRNWEKEIYANLHKCQVVIALYSKSFSSSSWCFAEIIYARGLGKYIIPLKINDCAINNILLDVQVIDATTNLPEAFQRLQSGLLAAGINKEGWDSKRPPYPGLFAFQEEDAPVFFGREEETEDLLESLRQFRNFGGPKLLLVLGASGSGKSSLIRAGVVPHLRKDRRSWIIIGPFRPLKKPFEELSKSLANGFNQLNDHRSWEDIYNSLKVDSDNAFEIAKSVSQKFSEIIELSKEASVTLLVFIDQFEELLSDNYKTDNVPTDKNTVHLFLSALRLLLDSDDNKVLVIGALRSDFLGNFQESESLKALTSINYIVKSVNTESLRASITEPAKVAGIELQDGLAEVMLKDTGTPDALPLLAFTLRELYEQYGKDGVLEIEEYRNKLGGLEGSVARVAEAVLVSHNSQAGRGKIIQKENSENKATLDIHDEKLLKAAFMAMVRIDEEGRYTRRFTKWEELPEQITDLLERFVTARLLVKSGNGKNVKIEVAHEALFRTWKRLVIWIEEDRNFLIWRKRLNIALEEWERSSGNESALLRGPSLGEALQWLTQYKSGKYNLIGNEIEYINASYKEAEKQRFKKRRNRKFLLVGFGIVFIIISLLLINVYINYIETQNQLAINYWNNSQTAMAEGNFLDALHFSVEAVALSNDKGLTKNVLTDIETYLPVTNLNNILQHHDVVYSAVFSDDGKRILTASSDKTARLWEAGTGKQIGPSMNHEDVVYSAVFSDDGKRILTASRDKTARLWEAGTGKQIGPSMNHEEEVYSAVFSDDGKRILTASRDKTARLWEAGTGKQIGPFMKHEERVYSAVFSDDGKRILTASSDRTARLWEAGTGKQIGPSMQHEDAVYSAVFSGDGKRILTASLDKTARLWEAGTGKQIGPFMNHENWVYSAVFSGDGKRILTASLDKTARLWEAGTGKQIGPFMKHEERVFSAVFSGDGKRILTASWDKTARLWEAGTGKQIGPSMQHDDWVISAVFSDDGKRILTASRNRTARLWEVGTGKQIGPSMKQEETVYSAVFSEDGKRILTASEDSTARLWEAGTGKQIGPSMNHEDWVTSAVFNADGKRILTASLDSTARLWEAGTGKQIGPFMKHEERVFSAVFSGDGKRILTASLDSTARLWEAGTGKQIGPSMNHENWVNSAVFSGDGKRILTASNDRTARLWEAGTGKQIGPSMNHEDLVNSAVFSGDGKRIFTASLDKTARLWEAGTGKQIGPSMNHEEGVNSAVFSDDGKRILTASNDRTARLWEAGTGKQIGPSMQHADWVYSAVFSDDGKRILTASRDSTARLWEAGTGKQIGPSIQHADWVNSAVFSDDGKRILTSSSDKTARLWNIGGDIDIPVELFRLQAIVITGFKLNIETNETRVIPTEKWYELKKEYNIKAPEHYKKCMYPKYNLWARFNPEEAKKIRLNK